MSIPISKTYIFNLDDLISEQCRDKQIALLMKNKPGYRQYCINYLPLEKSSTPTEIGCIYCQKQPKILLQEESKLISNRLY